jgi:hypothetical protein
MTVRQKPDYVIVGTTKDARITTTGDLSDGTERVPVTPDTLFLAIVTAMKSATRSYPPPNA